MKVSPAEIEARVRACLAQACDLSPPEVDLARGFEELGLDSVARVELLAELEDRFETHLPPDDAIHLLCGRDVVRYLGRKLS